MILPAVARVPAAEERVVAGALDPNLSRKNAKGATFLARDSGPRHPLETYGTLLEKFD